MINIDNSGYNIDCKHSDLIRKNYKFLLSQLKAHPSKLIDHLFSKHVIETEEKEELESIEPPTRKTERLLAMLSRRPATDFQLFLSHLHQTGMMHVVQHMKDNSYTTSGG